MGTKKQHINPYAFPMGVSDVRNTERSTACGKQSVAILTEFLTMVIKLCLMTYTLQRQKNRVVK